MKKIISISLWGTSDRYNIGAIKNAELAKTIYSDWEFRVYYDKSIKIETLNTLKQLDSVLINCSNIPLSGHFWRFLSASDCNDEDYIIFRDSDSRLSLREKQCVDDWIISGKKYSIIRDHVRHYDFPILAGMWGIRGRMEETSLFALNNYKNIHYYTVDQVYLKDCVWEYAKNDCIIHGIQENEQFKESRLHINDDFVGQGYDEFDKPLYPRI